jgi:hypothetical protein
VLLFFLLFLKGAGGHGHNPFEFVYYLMFPLGFVIDLLPDSWGPQNDLMLAFLFVLAGLIQWAIVGYLVDKLRVWRRKRQLRIMSR